MEGNEGMAVQKINEQEERNGKEGGNAKNEQEEKERSERERGGGKGRKKARLKEKNRRRPYGLREWDSQNSSAAANKQ